MFYLLLSGCSTQNLSTVAYSPDGRIIAAAGLSASGLDSALSAKHGIFIYDPKTLIEQRVLEAENEKTLSGRMGFEKRPLAISFDSRFVAAAGRHYSVDVWDLNSGRQVMHFPQLAGAMAVAFSSTVNVLAVAGPTSETTLWSVPEGKLLAILRGKPTSPNTAVTFSPDGKTLAVGDANRTVRLWALPENREVGILSDHDRWVHSLSFSPDGKTLAVYAGRLKFWHLPEMRAFLPFLEMPDSGAPTSEGQNPAMFSPDGKFFAAFEQSKSTVLVHRAVIIFSFESKKTLRVDCNMCLSLTFSPDSSKLIIAGLGLAGSSPIQIWNPNTGERLR
jgi:WD40 repeat protein